MPNQANFPTSENEKIRPANENLSGLWTPFVLAEEVGKELGRSEILQ